MPKLVRPANSERAERALTHIGNLTKAKMIAWLRDHPNSTRKAVSDGLEVSSATVVAYLGELEGADLLIANPPRETRQRGEWVVYRVNNEVVTEAYLRFGQELGEF